MKPIIFYIDDEPNNLTVFESSLPEEWEVKTFVNPLQALEALETMKPAVIITDQRMPQISGVKFLELARKINDDAVRIICTGYSDENLIIQSVRSAQIFDYITKPWESDDLENSLRRAIDYYKIKMEKANLVQELASKNLVLEAKQVDLTASMQREESLRKEIECWVPPFVLVALRDKEIKFPIRKDIVGITFDIIDSSKIHGIEIEGRSLRSTILQIFSELILKHGGWRESHSGDSAYGHFGLFSADKNPYASALSVAQEFRVALRSISQKNKIEIECGIALHACKQVLMDIHTALFSTPHGTFTQRSFDTTSIDIDILHKIEKIVHDLPGSNIVMTESFYENANIEIPNIKELGEFSFTGRDGKIKLLMIPSFFVKQDDLNSFRERFAA